MEPWETSALLARLNRCERTGQLGGVEIEYWVGGGAPPPLYRSDQLRWLTVNACDTIELARPHFVPGYSPYPVEKFQLPAQPSDIQRVARLLHETGMFADEHPEQKDPGIADILVTEVIVTESNRQSKQAYYGRVPMALRPLEREAERLKRMVVAHGTRGLFHQGRPLTSE